MGRPSGILARFLPLLITVLAAAGAVFLFAQTDDDPLQTSPPDGTPADFTAFPLQIAPGFEGIVLIDRRHSTLCIYQYLARNPSHERLALLAARSFRYDCQLDDYNNADPRPSEIRQWLLRAAEYSTPESGRNPQGKPTGSPQPPAAGSDTQSHWRPPTAGNPPTTAVSAVDTATNKDGSAATSEAPAVPLTAITLKCVNPDCDFSGVLSPAERRQAVSQQLSQLRLLDAQFYQQGLRLARSLVLLRAADSGTESTAAPAVSDQQIQAELERIWGRQDYRLPFTCPKCGRMEVYQAIRCEACQTIFLPDPDQADATAVRCPACGKTCPVRPDAGQDAGPRPAGPPAESAESPAAATGENAPPDR